MKRNLELFVLSNLPTLFNFYQYSCLRKAKGKNPPLTFRIALNTGQLVKDDFFTLFESVGALEVREIPRHLFQYRLSLVMIDYGPKNGQWLPETQ